MQAVIVKSKDKAEMHFINSLLQKLGVSSRLMSDEEMEDSGLSLLMKQVDRTKKVSRASIMKKLSSK